MRGYDVTATALALGVNRKWLDNVLSHHAIAGVVRRRQGVRRRLAPDAVLELAVALELIRSFGLPLARAFRLAASLATSNGTLTAGRYVALEVDVDRLERELAGRLARAAEAAPPRRRGRPPTRRHGRSQ